MSKARLLVQLGKGPPPEWYYVTLLSNFARGYDKYARRYSKTNIPESTFPDRFFLLKENELPIGLAKGRRLLEKSGLAEDSLITLKTRAPESAFRKDHASGLGQYMTQNYIDLDAAFLVDAQNKLLPVSIEDLAAHSFRALGTKLLPWEDLTPRTVSVLPIAQACQASCRFCFSKASVSADYQGKISDWNRISEVLETAKARGAERAVITGGGEPTLLKTADLLHLTELCGKSFNKVVLITNGHRLARLPEDRRLDTLRALDKAGLNILTVSRHHHDPARNTDIMGLDTQTDNLLRTWRENRDSFKNIEPRFICVLQKGGVDSEDAVGDYLAWAAEQGVQQVNFKELYVSTGLESAYSDYSANAFSATNQVSLKTVFNFANAQGWKKIHELPWGAPVFEGEWRGQPMQIAAYTEPSVYWERTHGIARSWNLMSDGAVLASLEDKASAVPMGPR